ncbi:MAG TPA: hypothetical protein VIG41_07215 [Micrococcaceae bacterium]
MNTDPAADAGPPVAELLSPGPRFSRNELQAMTLDGVLQCVFGDAYVPATEAVTRRLRAAAVALAIPPNMAGRTTVGRLSAAWVYGCAAAPERITLLVDAGHRVATLRPWTGYWLHEVQLGRFDAVELEGCRITTPLRTAVDLALYAPHPAGAEALKLLAGTPGLGCPPGLIRAALLAQQRVPRRRAALALVDALGQPGPARRP